MVQKVYEIAQSLLAIAQSKSLDASGNSMMNDERGTMNEFAPPRELRG
jgi:hypothetical protein